MRAAKPWALAPPFGDHKGAIRAPPAAACASAAVTAVVDAADGVKRPIAAYGSPAGSSIINTVLNITLNLIDHGMAVQAVIVDPAAP